MFPTWDRRLPVPFMPSIPPLCEIGLRLGKLAAAATLPDARTWRQARRPAVAINRFSTDNLRQLLRTLQIEQGDKVLVHSSASACECIGWEPSHLIDFLLEFLGPAGTLLMPSHPRLQIRNGRPVYDVQRSPSTVGLMSELFRRRTASVRSKFPYSSVCAQGVDAEALLMDHARSYAPHDELSPYGKLPEAGGKVLLLNCSIFKMTIVHVAEDTLRASYGIDNFYDEEMVLVRDQGREFEICAHTR